MSNRREAFKKNVIQTKRVMSEEAIKDDVWIKAMTELDVLIPIYKELREAAIEAIKPCPVFAGRGIVICAGNERYFTCAYVLIRTLRAHGCTLPIQVWYCGKKEMSQEMIDILTPHNVECVDAYKVREQHPVRSLIGWACKVYSILHSPFNEVLFIDCDNVPTKNPEYLFDSEQFKQYGCTFWPDYLRLDAGRAIWKICEVPYNDEAEFESGQILVDKSRCWRELNLAMHMNEHHDFYYKHIHGDKETFHMAWKMLKTPYYMIPTGIKKLPVNGRSLVMCQHDYNGNVIFQHRNMDKWNIDGGNRKIDGFEHEAQCVEYIIELRDIWKTRGVFNGNDSARLTDAIASLTGRKYIFSVGARWQTIMAFNHNGTISGGFGHEAKWYAEELMQKEISLVILDSSRPAYRLKWISDGSWRGVRLDNSLQAELKLAN